LATELRVFGLIFFLGVFVLNANAQTDAVPTQKQWQQSAQSVSDNLSEVDPQMQQRVESVMETINSSDYQKSLKDFQAQLSEQVFGQSTKSDDMEKGEFGTETLPNSRVYVFVSSSMPLTTLRQYAHSLARLGRGVLVLRGFVGGAKEVKPTIRLIADILKKDSDCHGPQCPRLPVEVQIDPLRFIRYGIHQVPALVYEPDENFLGYCTQEALAQRSDRQVLYGAAPLRYSLETLLQHQPAPGLEALIARLEPVPWEHL